LGWQKNAKIKVAKVVFFIFTSSYAEMSFCEQKKRNEKEKVTKYSRVQNFCSSQNGQYVPLTQIQQGWCCQKHTAQPRKNHLIIL
jgi:hypothetical protein